MLTYLRKKARCKTVRQPCRCHPAEVADVTALRLPAYTDTEKLAACQEPTRTEPAAHAANIPNITGMGKRNQFGKIGISFPRHRTAAKQHQKVLVDINETLRT